MPTEYIYIQGKAKWFKHNTPNSWGKYTHVIYPNHESLEKIRELQAEGIKNILRKDEDGYYISFSRPTSVLIKGKVVGIAPPLVFQADGTTPLRETMVGNGSDITTKLEVYQHSTPGGGKAKAARWLSTKVDNLVPFHNSRDLFGEQEKAWRGMEDQPEQLF